MTLKLAKQMSSYTGYILGAWGVVCFGVLVALQFKLFIYYSNQILYRLEYS